MKRPAWLLGLLLLAAPAAADEGQIEQGRAFAEENCSRCHAVGATGESPLEPAPPFRTLHRLWPLESLEEALGEGIVVGHPDMPEFELEPEQIDALLAYIGSLPDD